MSSAEIAAAEEAGIKVVPVFSGNKHGSDKIDEWVKEFTEKDDEKKTERAKMFPEYSLKKKDGTRGSSGFGYVFKENARDVLNKQNPEQTSKTLKYLTTLTLHESV